MDYGIIILSLVHRKRLPEGIVFLFGLVYGGGSNKVIESAYTVSGALTLSFIDIRTIEDVQTILGSLIDQPTYWRLMVHKLIPEGFLRCVYLDLDTLVLSELNLLFSYDLQGKTIGACIDYLPTMGDGVSNCTVLGLDSEKPYFNAGVLFIDIERYRQKDISNKVVTTVLENADHLLAKGKWPQNDQYGLNVLLVEDWLLPHSSNTQKYGII